MFTGTHVNGIDAKGRVSFPADFRARTMEQGLEGAYVWPAVDGGRLDGCGADLMARYEQVLRDADPVDGAANPVVRAVLAGARLLKFDATGRITVPKKLVDSCGLADQAVFVGRGDRFEVWGADAWREQAAEEADAARQEAALTAELAQLERQVVLQERRNALLARAAQAKAGPRGDGVGYDSRTGDRDDVPSSQVGSNSSESSDGGRDG